MDANWKDAIMRGDVQDLQDLLNRGTDVDARDQYGQTALMLAASAGHRELVEALIAHRASLNTTAKYGLTALMLALIGLHWSRLPSLRLLRFCKTVALLSSAFLPGRSIVSKLLSRLSG